MATLKRFEDSLAWRLARELSLSIHRASGSGQFARDFGLRDQIRRAAVSVMSNIAEGFERHGSRELVRFLYIAKGSAGEVRSQLYVALDVGYLTDDEFRQLHDQSCRCIEVIGGWIRYLVDSVPSQPGMVKEDSPDYIIEDNQ